MINVTKLSKYFGEHVAVDNIDLSIPKGAMYGFLGPNGAGKTTTLRMMMGLLQPTSGEITINETRVMSDPIGIRAKVGYLPDEIFLYDYLTGYQFLEFVADIHKIKTNTAKEKIIKMLDLFGLSEVSNEYTANYSFGMKKKLALAGIVLHEPLVLLLDEPFNGLDPQATRDFRSLLDSMVKKGTTVIFSSHVLEVVEKLVTHAGIISKGKIQISAPKEEIIERYGSLEKAFFRLT